MAAAQPQSRDSSSPGLSLSLSSNNPFRNRAGSPLPKSPASPFDDPTPQSHPVAQEPSGTLSNNPFLDPSQQLTNSSTTAPPPLITMADEKPTTSPKTEDLFADLSLLDKSESDEDVKGKTSVKSPPLGGRPGPRGPPPPGRRGPPPPGHRPMGSRERRPGGPPGHSGPPGLNSPPRRMAPASGSGSGSGSGRHSRRPITEEEKKKYRERRAREGKDHKKRALRDPDVIDKLDESSGYRFHHGGPYDAVFPRHKGKNAPLHAFAKDSVNMSMGGSGPLNARPDHSTFMGVATEEAFTDYSSGISVVPPTKKDLTMFDPHMRVPVVHGDETQGLGTSTFLEGTPAAKAAVEKAEQENAALNQDGGLSRKKSLAQRIRGMNSTRRAGFQSSGRVTNPDTVYGERGSSGSMTSPRNEANPFFAEYEPNKGGEEQITVRKMSAGGPTSPPLPGGLERRATTDALGGFEQAKPKTGGGLLGRMKSLKGGPRSRPDKDAAA